MIWKLPRPFIIARFRSLYCPLTIEWRVSISWTRHWPFHCTACFRIWFADSQLLLVHGAKVFGRPVFSLVSMLSLSSGITGNVGVGNSIRSRARLSRMLYIYV